MELQDSILKGFADAVNSTDNKQDSKNVYGTITRIGDDDFVYVTINGAEIETPAKTLVQVGVGDTVLASINGHTLTVIGNISYPSLTRVGDVYITLTADGLLIGRLDDNNQPVGSYMLVSDSSTTIYDHEGVRIATFGASASIGKPGDNPHINLHENGMTIYVGGKMIAAFSPEGITLRDENGNILAAFQKTGISLRDTNGAFAIFTAKDIAIGTASDAAIKFCAGKGVMSLDDGVFKVKGGNSVSAIGLSNSYATYKSEVVCEAKNASPKAALQLMNGSTTITSLVLSDNGANVTVPSGKALTENGKEVAKLDKLLAFGSITARGSIPGANNSVNQYGDVILDPGEKSVTINVSNIPKGYTLCGVRGITAQISDVLVEGYYCNPNNNKLTFTLNNYDYNAVTTNVYIYWFAIKNTGVSTQPSQSITW